LINFKGGQDVDKIFIGCCGAYCKTCKPLISGACKGCKLGYDTGERDINKSKCRIKDCCFKEKGFQTCADCTEFDLCPYINNFYGKNGYKYGKYKQAIEFIRKNGYTKFIRIAAAWKNQYGKYR